jgi:hypothetical protein
MTPLNKAAMYARLVVVQSLNGSPTPLSTFIASLAVTRNLKAGIPKTTQQSAVLDWGEGDFGSHTEWHRSQLT